MPQGEMDNIEMDRKFLLNLAKRLKGSYFDVDSVEDKTAGMFDATTKSRRFSHMLSLWPRWPLMIGLCLLLSTCWFIRRAIGLV